MMKKIIFHMLLALVPLSCARIQEAGVDSFPAAERTFVRASIAQTKVAVDAAGKTSWEEGDEIGIFMDGRIVKFTLSEGAGTADGVFSTEQDLRSAIANGVAVFPYDNSLTLSGRQITVKLAASAADGETLPAPMSGVLQADGTYAFRNVAALLRLSWTNLPSLAEYVKVTADKSIAGTFTLADYATSTLSLSSSGSGKSVSAYLPKRRPGNAASVDIPIPSGTLTSVKVELYGADGSLIDSRTTSSEKSFTAGFVKPLQAVSLSGDRLKLEWVFDNGLPTFRSNVPAIDNQGNVYVSTNEAAVYKLGNTGRLLWRTSIEGVGGMVETSPSVEADGSAVYFAGGQDGNGQCCALNADGSVKWTLTNYPWGASSNRNFWQSFIGVGSDNLYVPVGTLCTILSVKKTDGSRVAYGSGKADGSSGNLFGAGSGCAVGLGGTVSYMTTKGGGYTWSKQLLDNPNKESVSQGKYALWGYQDLFKDWGAFKASCDKQGIVATKKGPSSGVDVIISCGQEEKCRMDVVCYPASYGTGNTLKRHDNDQLAYLWRYQIGSNTQDAAAPQKQDQGGIVMGHENLVVIVPMKNRSNATDSGQGHGGLFSVHIGRNPADGGWACWRVSIPEDVSGAAAVDNNGNVHFATDKYYYIIKPNTNSGGSYQILAKESIRNLLLSDGHLDDCSYTGVWSSVKIAQGGKIYLNINIDNNRGVTCCFTYPGVTGPDTTSSWPQKGADQYNSCNQQL